MTLRWLTATTMLRWLTATTMRRWSTAHVLFPCFVWTMLSPSCPGWRTQAWAEAESSGKRVKVPASSKACLSPCPGASNLPQDSYICVLASLFVQYLRDEGQRIQHDKRMELERFWKEDFARACPMYATCARLLRNVVYRQAKQAPPVYSLYPHWCLKYLYFESQNNQLGEPLRAGGIFNVVLKDGIKHHPCC